MKTLIDERLREEARVFSFRFGCEDCAYFEPTKSLCGNGYPTAPHARIELALGQHLEFCKEFEYAGPPAPT